MSEELSYRCPFCDCEVQVGRLCPGCAKNRGQPTGTTPRPWEQADGADGLDLPDTDFDYDEFVAREFGQAPHRRLGVAWYWWALGVLVLATMLACF
jgi:hypothetical protein